MELTYRKCGDYYIPNLTLGDTKEYNIGKYGWLRRTYLKKQRPAMYNLLLATDRLMPHLEEVETACQAQLEVMEKAMMAQEGVKEALKAADQMEWVRRCNSIRSRAEEVILQELVYG